MSCRPAPNKKIEDLRVGNTPITEFDNVEIEFLNVDKDYTLAHTPGLDALTGPGTFHDQPGLRGRVRAALYTGAYRWGAGAAVAAGTSGTGGGGSGATLSARSTTDARSITV